MAGYCSQCGNVLSQQDNFCPKCGAKIEGISAGEAYPRSGILSASQQREERSYDGFAIASLVFSLTVVFYLIGLIFGIVSLVRISRNPRLKGQWMAVTGIVAGPVLGLLAYFTVLGAIFTPGFLHARSHGQFIACQSNLKNIGTALEMYATDNGGRYPASLEKLSPTYLKLIPVCPSSGLKESYGYLSEHNPDYYRVWCKGSKAHAADDIADGYPQYNSTEGLILQGGAGQGKPL